MEAKEYKLLDNGAIVALRDGTWRSLGDVNKDERANGTDEMIHRANAAPDLLAALEDLLEAVYAEHQAIPSALNDLGEEGMKIHATNVSASRQARAAIARARGGE